MFLQRSVPFKLTSAQYNIICRDICKNINYSSPDRELAIQTPRGLMCSKWKELPEWVRSGEVSQTDAEVVLRIDIESDVEISHAKILLDELQDGMKSFFSHSVQHFQKRVFCIGWSKTGTTSITEALRILGLFSWHFAPWVIGFKHWFSEPSLPQSNFSSIYEYGAVSDLPICALFRELDREFPGSLFILTTRSLDEWIPSAISDIAKGVALTGSVSTLDQWAYGTNDISREVLMNRYIQHNEQAREYFSGRKDFLAIDLSRGNPWKELCGFLQLPIPSVEFPHKNRRV